MVVAESEEEVLVDGARRVAVVGDQGGIPSKAIASTREKEEGTGTEWSREDGRVTRRGGRGPREAE